MPEDYTTKFAKGLRPEMRAMRKLELCARARAETTTMIGARFAEREACRKSIAREEEVFFWCLCHLF